MCPFHNSISFSARLDKKGSRQVPTRCVDLDSPTWLGRSKNLVGSVSTQNEEFVKKVEWQDRALAESIKEAEEREKAETEKAIFESGNADEDFLVEQVIENSLRDRGGITADQDDGIEHMSLFDEEEQKTQHHHHQSPTRSVHFEDEYRASTAAEVSSKTNGEYVDIGIDALKAAGLPA